jgi:hypothetical protein
MTPGMIHELVGLAWRAYASNRPDADLKLLYDGQGIVPRGFVFKGETVTFVSIKGTSTLRDALMDAKVAKSLFMGKYSVHTGCLEELDAILGTVWDNVSITKPLYMTGHSLGGGIVTLLAWWLKEKLGLMPSVATFGSLAVMAPYSAEAYDRAVPDTVRVVHNMDLIPRLPPKELEYAHVGNLLHLNDAGREIGTSKVFGWLDRLWTEVQISFKDVEADLDGEAEGDHHVKTYVKCVSRWIDRVLNDRKYFRR